MAILSFNTTTTGTAGILPSMAEITTNDTESTVLTAGYLNKLVQNGASFSLPCMALVSTQTSSTAKPDVGWFEIQHSGANWSLTSTQSPGNVTLPTIVNHIATYTNVNGGLGEDATTAINGGNIQAGLSGTAGFLASFPSAAAKGSLRLTAVANTGNTLTTISNAAMGQASVISMPDPGVATTNFLLTDSAGTQTISTGSLALTVGSVTATAGNLQAGSSGHAGTVSSFPATAANGSLILAGVNAGGAFTTTISNGTMGQSTVYSMGDIGASTGGIVVATSAIRMKAVAAAAAAGGNAAQSFTDTFCTTGSVVIGNWVTQTTPQEVVKIVPGNGSFIVTSTGDAGSGTFSYIITK